MYYYVYYIMQDLDAWTQRLEDIFSGKPKDSLDLALVDVKERYPTLPIRPFKDMIGGMLMDIPGAGKSRYGMCKMSTVIQRLL